MRIIAAQDVAADAPKQEIAKQEVSKKGQEQPQTQNNNQAVPKSVAATPQPPAPPADKPSQNSSEDQQIQRWLMYFTGALVVVGILQFGGMAWQARLLRRTREDVHTQAQWMEKQAGYMAREGISLRRQTTLLRKAADAADESAKAANAQIKMVRDRERARISVSIPYEEFEADVFESIPIKIANDGTTSAFNVRAKGEVFGQPSENLPQMVNFMRLEVPDVLRANSEPVLSDTTLTTQIDLRGVENSPLPYYFHLAGLVEYEDVFGDSHRTAFRFRLQVSGTRPLHGTVRVKVWSLSGWKRCGSAQENHAD